MTTENQTGTSTEDWTTSFSRDIAASPRKIWQAFCDVPRWPSWNAGIESIALEGPFATGTWFTMKPPGQEALRSRLIEVRENEGFVDETRVGELVVTVAHRIAALSPSTSRVTYEVAAKGPEAAEIGPAVSSDFPEVLAGLARVTEG